MWVGCLRLDARYARPLDIYSINGATVDHANRFAVVPASSDWRLMYGPAAAVRIWAAKTLPHLERRAAVHLMEDYVLHPELILSRKILPANERETSHAVVENPDIKATAMDSGAGTRRLCATKAADTSNLPSMLTSTLPSVFSSILPSLLPSTLPSLSPSTLPSILLSILPRFSPSTLPSLSPLTLNPVLPSILPGCPVCLRQAKTASSRTQRRVAAA